MDLVISGPNYFGINSMVERAFYDIGYRVRISNWPDMNGSLFDRAKLLIAEKLKPLNDITYNHSCFQNHIFREIIFEYNRKLIEEISTTNPNVLLVLKGDILLPKTIEKIRNNNDITLILWCYDSALRYKNVLEGGKNYHIVYTFEPTDVQKLSKHHFHAEYLPMAYDPNIYYKFQGNKLTNDIAFIGKLEDNPERKNLLDKVASHHRGRKINIWGQAWTWYNPSLQYEYKINRRTLGSCIHNHDVTPETVNKIYNSTKVCLNIHHRQSKEGVNPRTFEILGSGGFQLVDYKRQMEVLFDIGKDLVCYNNEEDLFKKIEYFLENKDEREKIARHGNSMVKKKHTFKHRAITIHNDIEKRGK